MKLHLNREALLTALTPLLSVLDKDAKTPVLASVRLQASHGRDVVALTATNLDTFVVNTVDGAVFDGGDCCVNARLLSGLLKKLTGEDVQLTLEQADTDQPVLQIVSMETTLTTPVFKGAEFPPAFQLTETRSTTLPAATLRSALLRSLFCVSDDETRYVLNGVNFEFAPGAVAVAATDGRRLSCFQIDADLSWFEGRTGPQGLSVTVPTVACQLLLAMLATPEEEPDVTVTVAGPLEDIRHISFTVDGYHILTTKLIAGNFPNYRHIVPQPDSLKRRFSFPLNDLKPALERAVLLSSNAKSRAVRVEIEGRHAQLTLQTQDGVQLVDKLTLCGLPRLDENVRVTYDSTFLLQALNVVEGEYFFLNLTDDVMNPCVINDNTPWTHVLMPVADVEAAAEPEAKDEEEADDEKHDAPAKGKAKAA